MGGRSSKRPLHLGITRVMRRLGSAISRMEDPVVEKMAKDNKTDPFRVLIATMLSAQTKDAVTLEASNRLFERAATPQSLVHLPIKEIQRLIYPVSFYRIKARHLKETCRKLLSEFRGKVPATINELLLLPGVGRKTANLVLIVAYRSSSNICVDTHVHRISKRLGWVDTNTPELTEQALYDVVPRQWWSSINLYLVTWGQNICRPIYPLCGRCEVSNLCPRIGVTRVGR